MEKFMRAKVNKSTSAGKNACETGLGILWKSIFGFGWTPFQTVKMNVERVPINGDRKSHNFEVYLDKFIRVQVNKPTSAHKNEGEMGLGKLQVYSIWDQVYYGKVD